MLQYAMYDVQMHRHPTKNVNFQDISYPFAWSMLLPWPSFWQLALHASLKWVMGSKIFAQVLPARYSLNLPCVYDTVATILPFNLCQFISLCRVSKHLKSLHSVMPNYILWVLMQMKPHWSTWNCIHIYCYCFIFLHLHLNCIHGHHCLTHDVLVL